MMGPQEGVARKFSRAGNLLRRRKQDGLRSLLLHTPPGDVLLTTAPRTGGTRLLNSRNFVVPHTWCAARV